MMARPGYKAASWAALCFALCVLAQTAAAQNYRMTYNVGDETGWAYINKTSGAPADYQAWAAQHTFFVNDVLRFVYEPNESDIYAYENLASLTSCNISGAQLLDNGTSGLSEWFLPEKGFYNLGSSKHCADGQKFRIFVNVSTVPFVPEPPMAMPPDHDHMAPELPIATAPSTVPAAKPIPTPSACTSTSWTSVLMVVLAGITLSGSITLNDIL